MCEGKEKPKQMSTEAMKMKQDEPQTTAERRQNVMFYVLAPQHGYTRVMPCHIYILHFYM